MLFTFNDVRFKLIGNRTDIVKSFHGTLNDIFSYANSIGAKKIIIDSDIYIKVNDLWKYRDT